MPPDRPGSFTIWRYRRLLPVPDGPVRHPLPVGGTPLLSAPALRRTLGTPRLWIKDETRSVGLPAARRLCRRRRPLPSRRPHVRLARPQHRRQPGHHRSQETVAFEVWEQLGRQMPDVMIAPVGDGPTLVALDKGFRELVRCGLATRQPRLIGVQAEHCQPLVRAWLGEAAEPAELDPAATVADGIAVVRPAIGDAVLDAMHRGGGGMVAVTDDALLCAVTTLAGKAGVGAEPAGAAAQAGLEAAIERGLLNRLETIVLLITGREVKTGGGATNLGRIALVETLDQVERVLEDDC
jgi:threonine synthase